MPYTAGQTNEKLVSRFTRMHQAAHAEPHLLCYKPTERTRELASKRCYEVIVYTSLRHSCRKIYGLYVILEFRYGKRTSTRRSSFRTTMIPKICSLRLICPALFSPRICSGAYPRCVSETEDYLDPSVLGMILSTAVLTAR